jgi:oligosaccharide repeat unit polymerase
MIDVLASPWIPTIAMLLLACGARLLSRSWLVPGPFALAIWGVYLVVPLTVAPEYKVPSLGVWVILLLIVCIAIGADLGAGEATVGRPSVSRELSSWKKMLHLSFLLSFLGLLGALCWTGKALGEHGLDLSLPGLFGLGHILSVERYAGDQPPFLVRALVVWVYPAVLLGGMSFATVRRRRDRVLCLLPLVPSVLLSVIQAAKANTLIAVALGLSGYLAMRAFVSRGARRQLTRKTIFVIGATVGAAILFFLAVDILRSHKQEEELQLDPDWGRVKSASLGYLAVFSQWANSAEGPGAFHVRFGTYTFGGLLDAVGLHSREIGIYAESISLDGDESNIYTTFRGLIEDFSLTGATVFCFLIGFLSGRAYKNSLLGRDIWTLGLAGFYAFLLWSPIGSLYVYNGPVLAILVGIFAVRKAAKSSNHQPESDSLMSRPIRTA